MAFARLLPRTTTSRFVNALSTTTHQLRTTTRLTMSTLSTETAEQRARRLFRTARVVCFDVDSTVSTDEGIDVLAERLVRELHFVLFR
jgi:hypothetical protein